MEVRLVGGKLVRLAAITEAVTDADGQFPEGGQHIELRQRERGDPVQAHRVTQRDEVEPTAAALAAGDGPELAAEFPQALLIASLDLGRERALADAGHVGLGFFFSSRRRHTRSDRDWSSDVCSSD